MFEVLQSIVIIVIGVAYSLCVCATGVYADYGDIGVSVVPVYGERHRPGYRYTGSSEVRYCPQGNITATDAGQDAVKHADIQSAIIEASQKAATLLRTIQAMISFEEEAMLPCHRHWIHSPSGRYAEGGISNNQQFIYTHTVWGRHNGTTVWHAVVADSMPYYGVCVIVHLYERFYYRQREAYPPCGEYVKYRFLPVTVFHQANGLWNGIRPHHYNHAIIYGYTGVQARAQRCICPLVLYARQWVKVHAICTSYMFMQEGAV